MTKKLREQGAYEKPACVTGAKGQPQNVVRAQSPRKMDPPSNPTKTPAPVKGAKGKGNPKMAPAVSKQEARVRGKVRQP